MASVKLYTFGPPRLEHAGHPVELNLRKALALLVYLAVTDRPQSRDTLATLLWPDANQREGRARLRRTLHRLREALDEDVLTVFPEQIQLRPEADLWLDHAVFLRHVAAGLSANNRASLNTEQLGHLAATVELYTDDFLAGFTLPDSPAFDEWQFFERERLRQALTQVLGCLVQVHEAQGDVETAIGYARRLLSLDPLDETIHR